MNYPGAPLLLIYFLTVSVICLRELRVILQDQYRELLFPTKQEKRAYEHLIGSMIIEAYSRIKSGKEGGYVPIMVTLPKGQTLSVVVSERKQL